MNFKKVVEEYARLSIFGPRFISITYGALGSSQKNSLGLIKAFKESHNIDIVAHLTLVGKTKNQLNLIIDEFKELGVTKIVALRGDVAEGNFLAHKEGFANTSEFVESLINSGMEVIVSAYPEPHPESSGFNFDLNLLKAF